MFPVTDSHVARLGRISFLSVRVAVVLLEMKRFGSLLEGEVCRPVGLRFYALLCQSSGRFLEYPYSLFIPSTLPLPPLVNTRPRLVLFRPELLHQVRFLHSSEFVTLCIGWRTLRSLHLFIYGRSRLWTI
eukprot:6208722-Pleurochrysis_carterae.AAC.2